MQFIKRNGLLILLSLLLLWAIWITVQTNNLMEYVRSIGQDVDALADQQESMWTEWNNRTLQHSESSLTQQSEPEEPEFEPFDIPIEPYIQEMVFQITEEYDIDPAIILRLIWRESGGNPDAYVAMDTNGYPAYGLCQLNGIALPYLLDRGIDPTESPEINISAACELIAYYRDECGCTLLESLAAYGTGLTGMRNGNGFTAAQRLISGEGFDF